MTAQIIMFAVERRQRKHHAELMRLFADLDTPRPVPSGEELARIVGLAYVASERAKAPGQVRDAAQDELLEHWERLFGGR